jgi:hypothetical protein
MPTSTTRRDVLAYLKCFFGLQVAFLAINYYKTSTKPSNFTTTLAAVIVLDQLD